MITTCLFDFGQTLVNSAEGFRSAEISAQTRIFKDLDLESWSGFLTQYRWLRKDFHSKSIFSRRTLWQRIYSHYNQDPSQDFLLEMERDYWEQVKDKTAPFPETLMVLDQLSSRYQLGMITNTQGQTLSESHRIHQFPEIVDFFKVIVVAGDAGVPPKPDPRPFLVCLDQLGVNPETVIYVGDDWIIDICGAAGVGIQPVWLKHHSVSRTWPKVETQVPIIMSLEQLFDLDL